MNHLKAEKSPYLQQHADNPVWWYPWGGEAFQAARRQKKLIFLSVGYSTCHWCHVMERESFTNSEVAAALNRSFIAIKVDREERPDVDATYMEAVQAMTGSGGWPMTVILTPEGKPFFGGTYFPKDTLLELLAKVEDLWKQDPSKLEAEGRKLTEWLASHQPAPVNGELTNDVLKKFYESFKDSFDPENGGHLGRPKFPPAYALRLLLRIHRRTGNETALSMVKKTLGEMSRGGIYDHVGGGFHRYSTDEKWLVPHFEKMLYDQASLLVAYVEAFQVTGNREYELVARETADYVLRDMTSPEGGFYSAEDADSEGIEGKFYTWAYGEMKHLVTSGELDEIRKSFALSSDGNFEGGVNILNLKLGASRAKRSPGLKSALQKIFAVRAKRVRPRRDEKVTTAWNGLMISALARAGAVLSEPRYLAAATRAAKFVLDKVTDGKKRLLRRWAKGESRYPAYLEDYAFMIDALIELFQASSESRWIEEAVRLQVIQDALFYDEREKGYFATQAGDLLLKDRKKDFEDNVTPSGNSVAILNLLRLSAFYFDQGYRDRALETLKAAPNAVRAFPSGFPQLLAAVDYMLDQSKEIAVVSIGESAERVRARFSKAFMPSKVFAMTTQKDSSLPLLKNRTSIDGKPTFYVCMDRVCKRPTTDVEKALEMAGSTSRYPLR